MSGQGNATLEERDRLRAKLADTEKALVRATMACSLVAVAGALKRLPCPAGAAEAQEWADTLRAFEVAGDGLLLLALGQVDVDEEGEL